MINIVMMIFVNAGGAGYYFFEHAPWNGLYVADLVFPWFVWIMGAAIPLALGAHLRRLEKNAVPDPRRKILLDSGWRAVKLFFIGLVLCTLGGRNDLQKLRVFGVLQRLGVCYFLATAIFVPAAKTAYPPPPTNSKWKSAFHGVITMLPAWILTLPLVIIHTVVTFLLPVPGCPTGYLGPGGLHEDGAHYPECVGGATGYIDREILTLNHMYPWPTPQELYRSAAFDPEGLWGILPAVFQTVLGAQAGLTLLLYKDHKTRVFHWVSWGVGSGILGLILRIGDFCTWFLLSRHLLRPDGYDLCVERSSFCLAWHEFAGYVHRPLRRLQPLPMEVQVRAHEDAFRPFGGEPLGNVVVDFRGLHHVPQKTVSESLVSTHFSGFGACVTHRDCRNHF